jgi:hypothetical protein
MAIQDETELLHARERVMVLQLQLEIMARAVRDALNGHHDFPRELLEEYEEQTGRVVA